MKTQIRIFPNAFILFLLITSGKMEAQCSAAYTSWGNPNIPATAMVAPNTYWNTDGVYIWSWGDGSLNDTTYFANQSYPAITHNYSAIGTYTICLNYRSASAGCNLSTCYPFTATSITLPPKSITMLSAYDSSFFGNCPTLPVTGSFWMNGNVLGFTPSDSVDLSVFFGDGTDTVFKVSPNYSTSGPGNVSGYNIHHTYTVPGIYSIQYIISSNPAGVADTIIKYNEIDLQDSCGNLHGYVYTDMNGNCLLDNGDSILSNMWINILSSTNNTYWAWTDSVGYYSITIPVGNTYTISIPYLNTLGYTYACSGSNLTGITIPSTVNVGLDCPIGFDLSAIMWGWGFKPGVNASVQVWPVNFSCLPHAGTATLTLDPNTTFVNEMYGKPVTVSGSQVSWSLNNLSSLNYWWWYNYNWASYGSQRYIRLICSTNLQIGDSVCYTLAISPTSGDVNPANNTITRCYPVKNSWDPNFKEVYPRGVGAQGYVAQNTEFTYTIHFQNTGTAPAHNIAVLDTMDIDLDMSTFQIIASSHYVEPHLIGNNLIKFEFNNIMLPDSATNPVASQGWVTYKIKAKANQANGTQYSNTAYIYFDFNPAIVTNSTLNTISIGIGINDVKNSINKISVAPNPVNDFTQLTLQSNETGKVTLQIIDMLGQVVASEEKALNMGKNIFTIETKKLSEGIYLLNVISEKTVIGTVKIVK